jgi:hypothetical protein
MTRRWDTYEWQLTLVGADSPASVTPYSDRITAYWILALAFLAIMFLIAAITSDHKLAEDE